MRYKVSVLWLFFCVSHLKAVVTGAKTSFGFRDGIPRNIVFFPHQVFLFTRSLLKSSSNSHLEFTEDIQIRSQM